MYQASYGMLKKYPVILIEPVIILHNMINKAKDCTDSDKNII